MSLYQHPPVGTTVLCLDEMGPVSAKTYLARQWASRSPKVAADYGLRGVRWVFGAFSPASGEALTHSAERRDTAAFLALLDEVVAHWTEGHLVLILDNLSIHKSLDVRLWALAHPHVRFLFQPTYAPWLNLIEPWWKILRGLALKGKRFVLPSAIDTAILTATSLWNQHRHPFRWHRVF